MTDRAARLRSQSRRFARPDSPTATRYSAEFRAEAVAVARERISAGVAVARIARDLGIRPRTLALWLRRAPVPKFRAVRVRRDPAGVPAPAVLPNVASGALVVFVGGVRIEGLDLDGVVRLVRAFA